LLRLSEDGFDVLDKTWSPSMHVAPSTVHQNVAAFQIPEVVRDDCKHVRIAVECFTPRALDLEHESIKFELQTKEGVVSAAATARQLSERGWYLLELDILPLDRFSSTTQLTCRLQSEELTLSEVSGRFKTGSNPLRTPAEIASSKGADPVLKSDFVLKPALLIGDVLLFPQASGHIRNYTIGPLSGLADGTLAAVNPEEFVLFWDQSSEQPRDRWSDEPNESPGLRAIAASSDRVLVGTRFGNAFILQQGQPAWRILGNVNDEELENGHSISSVELSQDGQLALIGRKDGSVVSLDLTDSQPRDLHNGIGMKNQVSAIAVSRDRTMLAVGDRDGNLNFWKIEGDNFREWFKLSSLQSPVRKMRFSPDGRDIFVLCDDERAVHILHLNALENEFQNLRIPERVSAVTAVSSVLQLEKQPEAKHL
jgi:hypothetical protein